MNTILIDMVVSGGVFTIAADSTNAGTQYENNVSRFVFVRDCLFKDHNLILAAVTSRGPTWRDVELPLVNITTENQYTIPDFMTQGTTLKLQLILQQGGSQLRSNVLEFDLRPALPKPGQSVFGDLLVKAFAEVEMDGNELVFKNMLGEQLARVSLVDVPVLPGLEDPQQTLENAISIVQSVIWPTSVDQEQYPNQGSIEMLINDKVMGLALIDATAILDNQQYIPPVAGTDLEPLGTNGHYTFCINLVVDADHSYLFGPIHVIIIATPYQLEP